jgi:hypothetical protein
MFKTTTQDAENSSITSSSISPGAGDNTLFIARATVDTAELPGPVYLQVFENNVAPVDNDVPVISKPLDENGFAELDFGSLGRKVAGACTIALSSSPKVYAFALKLGGGNLSALFDVQYT